MEKEIWKAVVDYPDYQISNLGRVKSFRFGKEKILKNRINCCNYQTIMLSNCTNKRKDLLIHRLIALHFIPNPENKPEINHKDRNRMNNKIENLEWVTHRENIAHAIGGENSHKSNFVTADIISIRYIYKAKLFKLKELAQYFNCSVATIWHIGNHRVWKNLH